MKANSRSLVFVAMIFAVAMMFIDQTIVVLAIPSLQRELKLSPTGSQWIVNGYLLSLSALFALGGRVADLLGHRRMVVVGVVGFAVFSVLCGATPTGSVGPAWIITFRVLQGASAAFLYPAALATVASSLDVSDRGKYLALFFSISGAMTAIGPIAGGYLTQWTWRAIFWINVPVAIIALILIAVARPTQTVRHEKVDLRGAMLISAGMALAVLGLQEASAWGWHSAGTWICLLAGVALLVGFVIVELRTAVPLVPLWLFGGRGFAIDNAVLFLISICFVPLFFFASLYAQVALGDNAGQAGLFLLVFFLGFTATARRGGKILDTRGARPTVILGCAISAVGFFLWGSKLHLLSFKEQWFFLALAGAGMGLAFGPVSTDALNRASREAYGAVTGLSQTVRNFAGSLGLAVLGSLLVTTTTTKVTRTLTGDGASSSTAHRVARAVSGASTDQSSRHSGVLHAAALHAVRLDFASATRTVVIAMAAIMAAAFLLSLLGMPRGRSDQQRDDDQSLALAGRAGS